MLPNFVKFEHFTSFPKEIILNYRNNLGWKWLTDSGTLGPSSALTKTLDDARAINLAGRRVEQGRIGEVKTEKINRRDTLVTSMSCIKDPDVSEQFNSKLEDIRSKLLNQAIGEMIDTEEELCRAHKQFFKSVIDTCVKKSKEGESKFETIQMYRNELEHIRALTKEKRDIIPETLSEREEKEIEKENMVRNIHRLEEGLAKKKELIISQNKANKARLKNLNKNKLVFQESLGLEIRKIHGEKLQFVFRNISHKDPGFAYTFILRISEEGSYVVVSCDPPIESMPHLERRLQETNNFSAFLANVRKEFSS
ncbi:hypothetical protein SKAU_G00237790 [Synaphobranchus kaupii]|uniref:Kinetochore protein SPC25 n=1 Tax=Synaphobranchus kaupii TaxID=118154 RepID=A0A9Q1F707_SYNKA|nr:hypothetical protein SKAU_G00237790 [Synaphobranchus kaupii]